MNDRFPANGSPMRHILLMRHAKSSWDDSAISDHDRPLNRRGLKDVPRMAAWLSQQTVQPDWCLCSTANRTRQTAAGLRDAGELTFPVETVSQLYLATPTQIISVLQSLPDEITSPLVIAHNPGLEELICQWSGKIRELPTATLAAFAFAELHSWHDLQLESTASELYFQSPKLLESE